jgi:hypothetical protein
MGQKDCPGLGGGPAAGSIRDGAQRPVANPARQNHAHFQKVLEDAWAIRLEM